VGVREGERFTDGLERVSFQGAAHLRKPSKKGEWIHAKREGKRPRGGLLKKGLKGLTWILSFQKKPQCFARVHRRERQGSLPQTPRRGSEKKENEKGSP